jgi:hypothetical protein
MHCVGKWIGSWTGRDFGKKIPCHGKANTRCTLVTILMSCMVSGEDEERFENYRLR